MWNTVGRMPNPMRIQLSYDPDADVWCAESEDLAGLVSEAPTQAELMDRVAAVAPELLAANGAPPGRVTLEFFTTREVPVSGRERHAEHA